MKRLLASLMFALIAVSGSGAEATTNVAAPKPRVRLDPVSLAAISEPAKPEREVADASKVFMEKYVVRGQSVVPRRETQDPKGLFSGLAGGRFAGADAGSLRIELGLWTSVDVMADDNRFKAPQYRANFDVLRIQW